MAARLLRDLPGVADTDDSRAPLVFWDTQGGDFPETAEDDSPAREDGREGGGAGGVARATQSEAAVDPRDACAASWSWRGVPPGDVAVITPYNAQLAVLSRALREREEFRGVELSMAWMGFQGAGEEAVVVSLVRSGGDVGFLAEKRRPEWSVGCCRR